MALLLCLGLPALGQQPTARDVAIEISAVAVESPPSLTLNWTASTAAVTSLTVYRKPLGATTWERSVTLPTNATSYSDTAVQTGVAYEYQVRRVSTIGTTSVTSTGFVAAGISVPAVHSRGSVVVLVDSALIPLASAEIDRFLWDLRGDGWKVIRHNVPRTELPPAVRARIQAARAADPAVQAVVILGSVAQPYSGQLVPDGHGDHFGAWPTDAYYGDLDGTWTDTTVNTTTPSNARNDNVPGDGKFDQSTIPSSLELQVGRVDFRDMPVFGAGGESATDIEARLLRRYLTKDHAWRHGQMSVPARGLVDDHFGYFGGEAFAASGWRNFSALVGRATVSSADWMSTLRTNAYLLAYGCGGGGSQSASGVGTTTDFRNGESRAVFTFLFGSYFGDWGYTNNFLRAPLAATGYGLTSGWAGRPHWFIHTMGMGETIGHGARLTANNSGDYFSNGLQRMVHIGLMGDPTLRLHVVAPPQKLTVSAGTPSANLSWTASADATAAGFLGYHVYRATNPDGPWTRLTGAPLTATFYSDGFAPASAHYAVRALRKVTSNSGTYENLSQAAFVVWPRPSGVLPPSLSNIPDQATNEDVATGLVSFTVADSDTPVDTLRLTATSSNTALVPPGNIAFAGSGTSRTLRVVPGANQFGTATLTVSVSDGISTAQDTFVLTVAPVNDAPVGISQGFSMNEDTSRAITLAGWDAEGSALSFSIFAQPTKGTLTGTPPNVTYVPAANVTGTDSFKFKVSDGVLTSYEATVNITINPVNDAPVAHSQLLTSSAGASVAITLSGSDVEGTSLRYTVLTQPTWGTLTGTPPALTYVPAAKLTGSDTFTFKVNDGVLDSAPATVRITVNPGPLQTDQ
ncbi:tandem-95 repeat protein [Pyxidicoccus xibeiensis]|uniref:tandem-95 repeat protein n=1 Tax=Pyxidicoccus xibeiensis TaxID=2906759 RepID=UPI0020A7D5C7|nr:tandem-95 repeat protein [Pyxidicoccus xibeiensis]MCP3142044.1 tandem-95 repeat protein [Pyxidicoccus xibeiensis]